MPKIPKKVKETKIEEASEVRYENNRRIWKCPSCGAEHIDFKLDVCRNQRCKDFVKI